LMWALNVLKFFIFFRHTSKIWSWSIKRNFWIKS
jgi:hypothetical protein